MHSRLRSGERTVTPPETPDAGLWFIGRIHTPWAMREDCPRQGRLDGPECRIEIFAPWAAALEGIGAYGHLEILYWLDRSRRDLVRQNPKDDGQRFFGTFALRSPQRPNPIGISKVRLVAVEGAALIVRGLDCLDGTPLIDIKPDRCEFTPKAPAKAADPHGQG
ncbi:tRNA-Thr(GGU) m(6)t(6)A37 methyltransferase TsaA [Roseovarius azorensis]|uniref:tRNA-Thr(GGU) m(6)t(6)A37 methyltransferase TsaA n=1 Tax=Roseovarius azorensis TaxID=1287727 RepID=A0A1H7UV36_9RHOB|nr:tRNA (N6-threonylcarbamoyladenosine(37)-N6)-methyltransferase TrmO [Roseovarius azorensis]SEM00832.1 tRNA-Thr(GGU) m(6)t(6)A37 methyltransferase TsaA [Roseovarius azorensis]